MVQVFWYGRGFLTNSPNFGVVQAASYEVQQEL
jgi:hypothetical protein